MATITLSLWVLTDLYGTNFEVLPGSRGPFSFWIFVGSMLAVAAVAMIFFKLRKWL
jgi:Mg2+ and Co2+ transporter CorA